MARSIGMAADATVFRAVITKKYPGFEPFTKYEGPYGDVGAARARVTFWTNLMNETDIDGTPMPDRWATGYVESGTVTWSKI